MPTAKRTRERITSGNWRPSKTLRFGQDSSTGAGSEDDLEIQDVEFEHDDTEMNIDTNVERQPRLTTASPYHQIHYTHPQMRVSHMIAWPRSLAAIKSPFHYNLTPQEGLLIPPEIVQQVSGRIRRTFVPDHQVGAEYVPPGTPYVHLGSTPFLATQVFLFLPNLRTSACYESNPGRVYHFLLERWVNDIWAPALGVIDRNLPKSWKSIDEEISMSDRSRGDQPYPTRQVISSTDESFDDIWHRIQQLSMKVPEFQHPFLLLYSNGEFEQEFAGADGPEAFAREFEQAWRRNIDMRFIAAEEDLQVEFDYGSCVERNLVMR